jgi:hypothetical protein
MNARELIETCRSRGVKLEAAGDGLAFEGPLTGALLDELRAHKPEILALLRDEAREAVTESWEERAAIMQHDAGMSRVNAEHAAVVSTAQRIGKPRLRVWAVRIRTGERVDGMTLIDPECLDDSEMVADLRRRFGEGRVVSVALKNEVIA